MDVARIATPINLKTSFGQQFDHTGDFGPLLGVTFG
jgi:hypothetical protein